MADEVIVVFKADIEQFKAQMTELGVKLDTVEKKTESVGATTDQFSKHTKGAAASISTLSKGLGGITGLLGITGRLFGVNTDKLEGFIFASREFIKVAKDVRHAQELSNLASKESIAVKEEEIIVNKRFQLSQLATVPIIGAVIVAIAAVAAIVVNYKDQLFDLTEAQKEKIKADDGSLISDDKVRASYNESIKTIRDLQVEYLVLTGAITEYQGSLINLENKNKDELDAIAKDTKSKVEEVTGFFATLKLEIAKQLGLGGLEAQKQIEDRLKIEIDAAKLSAKRNEVLTEEKKVALAKENAAIFKTIQEAQDIIQKKKDDDAKKAKEKAEADRKKELDRIKQLDKEIFDEAIKQLEALKKLGQASESPIEKENREHEERLRAAGIFGKSIESLTEFEHAALLREEQDFQDKINLIVEKSLDDQKKLSDAAFALEEKDQKDQDDAFLKNKEKAQKETLRLAKKGNKDALEILKERGKTDPESAQQAEDIEKEINDKRIEAAKQVSDAIFKAQQDAFDRRKELEDKEISNQDKNIETQRRLAENGLANTLAFEQKRAADLQRQQQKEAAQQKKIKLLEVFLNSLAEFSKSEKTPGAALSKALLEVALATAASAVFAEEGGIIGEIGHNSNLRRRHKGGGDVLLHAQTGEGILSRSEMDNLGKRNFHLLKDAARFPIRDDVFGMPKIALAGGMAVSNAEVVKELKALQNIVKNKRESHFEVDKLGNYIKTSIENGVTEVNKGKMPKPRFRG